MAKLERWIDKAVERKSARHEVNLRKALNKVLHSKEASRYLQILQDVVLQQPHPRQRELIQNAPPVDPKKPVDQNKPVDQDNGKVTDMPPPPLEDNLLNPTNPGEGGNPNIFAGLLESLLQSVILQARADIRNIFIWLCAGASGSKIDGRINGNDAFSSKALQDDVSAISHPNGKHSLSDIIDPRIGSMVLECLKGRLKDFAGQLDSLLMERLSQGKEFLLQQVASLIGIPRFLIPFSSGGPVENGRDGPQLLTEQGLRLGQGDSLFVNSRQHGPSSANKDRNVQDPAKALEWVVDTFINELKPLVDNKESKPQLKKQDKQDRQDKERANEASDATKEQMKASRIRSRRRVDPAPQQQQQDHHYHHHHHKAPNNKQRLQVPWSQNGPQKEMYEKEYVASCAWIIDRLG